MSDHRQETGHARARGVALAACAALAASLAAASTGTVSSDDDASFGPPDYVQVKAYLDRDAYHAGETARLAVEFRIDSSVHVNGNVPTDPDFQIPTDIRWDAAPAGVQLSRGQWPKPAMKAFEFTEGKKIAVLEGVQRAHFTLTIAASAEPGTRKVTGTFTAQGCTHAFCYAPQSDPVSATLRIVPADEETTAVNEDKFPPRKADGSETAAPGTETASAATDAGADAATAGAAPATTEVATAVEAASAAPPSGLPAARIGADAEPLPQDCDVEASGEDLGKKSLLLVYVLSFLGGLGLTLTPCVLPLVPITIGFFAHQQRSGDRPVTLATLYVLGLAAVYSALGTVAALSGSLFGAALQNPFVIVGIAAVLVALAASMFGLWDLNLPTSLSSRIGGGKAGPAGAAMMGGAMGLIAAPCVGPFVVSLLTYVAKLGAEMPKVQAAAVGGSLFFVLALGLGAPFFLVGLGAATIRPGEWMVSVKKVFGFLILGVAAWFLRPLVGDVVVEIAIVALLAGMAALLLFGKRTGSETPAHRVALRVVGTVAGVAAVALGTWFVGPGASESSAHEFAPYSARALAHAAESRRPVVIDFTAKWCTVCKEIEHRVFPHPRVQELFGDFVLLRADLSNWDGDPAVRALREQYQIVGLPMIVFLDRSGEEIRDLRVSGMEKPEDFAARLRCVSIIEVAQAD
jgi:thiol:disulfide interchange protein DsbD